MLLSYQIGVMTRENRDTVSELWAGIRGDQGRQEGLEGKAQGFRKNSTLKWRI